MSQRQLAIKMGISVGMINLILKRLVRTGLVQMTNLNKKKVQYVLSTEGFRETVKRSYTSINTTIQHYKRLQDQVRDLLTQIHGSGYQSVILHGDGDLRELIEGCIQQSPLQIAVKKTIEGEIETKPEEQAVILNINKVPLESKTVKVYNIAEFIKNL